MTPAALAARTRIPLEEVKAMLHTLEQPDPESRTPDADGRRIARLDEHRSWGWHIINNWPRNRPGYANLRDLKPTPQFTDSLIH